MSTITIEHFICDPCNKVWTFKTKGCTLVDPLKCPICNQPTRRPINDEEKALLNAHYGAQGKKKRGIKNVKR